MWPHIPPGEGPTEASWVAEHQVHRPVSKGVCLPLQHHLRPALSRESDAHWVCKLLKVQGTLTGKTGKLKGGDELKRKDAVFVSGLPPPSSVQKGHSCGL